MLIMVVYTNEASITIRAVINIRFVKCNSNNQLLNSGLHMLASLMMNL